MQLFRLILSITAVSVVNGLAIESYGESMANAGLASRQYSALMARTCPAIQDTDPDKYLGSFPAAGLPHCNWKQALICASLLFGCTVECGAALAQAASNPFTDAGCAACVGLAAGNCAFCWDKAGGTPGVCKAIESVPFGACLMPLCANLNPKLVLPGHENS